MDFSPLWISLKVAVCATVFTFFLGLLSARLVLSLRAGKALIDGIFSLPMVLPPTVVGFFLLIIFGKNSLLGGLLLKMGISVLFTWQGAVIAAVVVSFPIMYRAARGALEQVDVNLIYAARTLGMSETKNFFSDSAAGGMARCGGCHDSGIRQGYGGIRRDDHVSRKYSRKDTDHVGGNLHGSAER